MTEELGVDLSSEKTKDEIAAVPVKKERLGYVDVLRGIAIALVVLGHCAPPYLDTFIFTFHVPLFFFISGMLFSYRERQAPFFTFLKKRALRLLVPYFCFELLNFLISYALSFVYSGFSVTLPDNFIAIFTGFSSQSASYSGVAGRVWFFPCMFFAEIAFYFIYAAVEFFLKNLKGKEFYPFVRFAAYLFVACALYLFSFWENNYTPQWWLYTDVAIMGAVFLALGCAFSNCVKRLAESEFCVKFAVLVLSCAGWISFSYLNYFVFSDYVDVFMSGDTYGKYKSFIFAALCGIMFAVSVSSIIYKSPSRPVKFLTWLGNNSACIFPAHLYPLYVIGTVVFSPLYPLFGSWWAYVAPWIEFVLIMALTVPLVVFINKFAPFMLGRGYKRKKKSDEKS